ncbi:hypothetical protein CS542_09420 [Pedobacter sp. IW39]|nr:hypothetical protein CS542_09420 [Pedobacter sp. IW39]
MIFTVMRTIIKTIYWKCMQITLPFNIKYRSQFGISLNNYNNDAFTNPLTNQGASQVNGIGSIYNETFRYTWDNAL